MSGQSIEFEGCVLDHATGDAIEGATVVVHRKTKPPSGPFPATEQRTDAQGRFSFIVPPEQAADSRLYIELDVSHPNYAALCGHGYSLALMLSDMALSASPWFKQIELSPGEEVSGVVLDPKGQPLADAPIRYSSVGGAYRSRFVARAPERIDAETRTDAGGRFRFNAVRGAGITDFWVESQEHALLHHAVRNMRGDIGTFRLKGGVRLKGAVVDADGQPIAAAVVQLTSIERNEVHWPMSWRSATTDQHGRFAFAPVTPGAFELEVRGLVGPAGSSDRPALPLPAAFVKQKLLVDFTNEESPSIEIRAVPHVTVRIQYLDSAGQPTRGHGVHLSGRFRGNRSIVQGQIDEKGAIEMLVPKGLTDAEIHASTDAHSALRHRRGESGLIQNGYRINLGTLDAYVGDLFIVRYKAPILLFSAMTAEGRPLEKFAPQIVYVDAGLRHKGHWINGIKGDVHLTRVDDGRWRSSQLLTDEPFIATIDADGFQAASETLSLAEGQIHELKLVMTPKLL